MEARVELVRSGDRTRTSCTHERTCVGAANANRRKMWMQFNVMPTDFIFMFNWHCLSILNGLDVMRLFYLAGISLLGGGAKCCGVLEQNDPQNVKWEKNTCFMTSLRSTASFEPFCVKLSLSVWPVQVRKKQNGRKEGRKTSHKKCIFHVCMEQLLACGFQPNLTNVFV